MGQHLPLFYQFHVYLFGVVAIVAALTFITRKSPVAAALWLVVTLFCVAAEYVLLNAQFLAAIQIIVYAGAIMVVFLFVIMLLNLGKPSEFVDIRGTGAKLLAGFTGIVLAAEVGFISMFGLPSSEHVVNFGHIESEVIKYGAVGALAKPLFRDYVLAFELTSILLLIAMIGAVIIGRRRGTYAG